MTVGEKRVAFITGCSSGIGFATAVRMLERGFRVVATARRPESLAPLREKLVAQGRDLLTAKCDLRDAASMEESVALALDRFGRIDVLINNAGYALIGPVELVPVKEALRQLEVNTVAPMRLVQLVAPQMRARKRGLIISVSSIAGRMLVPMAAWYTASKHALEALTDALRFELNPDGIEVVSVLPGPVESEFLSNLDVTPPAADAPDLYALYHEHYMKRRAGNRPFVVSPGHVASTIVRITETRRPRPRYYITAPARVFNFTRRFVPDRLWDHLTKRAYGFDRLDREHVRSRSET